ncbi:hypothetical protein BH23THE1_BH23THE1_25030 [soil metagenome]
MFRLINTKTSALMVVVLFATVMVLGPATSSFNSVMAHYGVSLDKCKYDDDYYKDNKKDCNKNFKAHDEDRDEYHDNKHDDNKHDDNKHDDNKHDDNKHDDNNKGNSASQGIGQSQSSKQNSQVVSGGNTEDSGNNLSFQNQENSGNNALAQN